MRRLSSIVLVGLALLLVGGWALAQDDTPCYEVVIRGEAWKFCGESLGTVTPTPNDTPPPFPTPTIENSLTPSPTPQPTATPTPEPGICVGVTTANLHAREYPGGPSLGVIPQGDTIRLERRWLYLGDWWYGHYWLPSQQAYSHGAYFSLTGDCDSLPDDTPPEQVKMGFHVLLGEGASTIENYAYNVQAVKCLDGSFDICRRMKQANPSLTIVARTLMDCVPTYALFDAGIWWDQIKNRLPNDFDLYEIENECAPPDDLYGQWALFSIDMAQLVERDKGAPMLAFSFGPGWPEYYLLEQLVPYFNWVQANPLADGRYHGAAHHASVFATFDRPDMPWVNSYHIADRANRISEWLVIFGGPNLVDWPGQWWVTEWGLSDGYSGNWDAPYTCSEMSDAYHTTEDRYTADGLVTGATWWNLGRIGMWTSDHDCLATLWQ